MKIKLCEIEAISNVLFEHLRQRKLAEIEIVPDFYWDIVKRSRYDSYSEPAEFTLGQLSDDWTELTKILDGRSPPISYALVWLSAIIRCIGEEEVD